jgi:hypothetical protein
MQISGFPPLILQIDFFSLHSFQAGLPDFIDTIYQNDGKYTKLPQHYQMALKYTK